MPLSARQIEKRAKQLARKRIDKIRTISRNGDRALSDVESDPECDCINGKKIQLCSSHQIDADYNEENRLYQARRTEKRNEICN